MQCAESLRVQACFDGELDAPSAADMERHSDTCDECRALIRDLKKVRTALRQNLTNASTPPALRARVMRALDLEGAVKNPRLHGERLRPSRPPPFWKGAFSGIGATALAAGIVFSLLAPP